jgi:hypothetical protein
MRSDVDALSESETSGLLHAIVVACVTATSDVGGRDETHDCGFERGVGQLTQIAVDVDFHSE